MHDQLFATQDQWNGEVTSRPKGHFQKLAQAAGLDVGKWEDCYDASKYQLNVLANQREGERRQVGSTPTFVIGTKQIPGNLGYDAFKAYVDSAAALAPKPAADTAAKGAK
jgi:protein-disulfide isomerase